MGVYQNLFRKLNRAALIPFFVIGDPDTETSFQLVKTAIDAGADVLELGIPFSDPVADGPTIQKADIRAMKAGMTPQKALVFVKRITDYRPIPIGLLVYYNLIYQYGVERFFADFKESGGTSVLIADLSIDDADEIAPAAEAAGLETVFMVTPNTTDDRIQKIAEYTTGFIYTVSVLGTTGQRSGLSDLVKPLIGRLKSLTKKTICVGFGISTAQHAKDIAQAGADGVIIGSRIIKFIEDNSDDTDRMQKELAAFIKSVRVAIQP
ncbi:MAG: tryptophan synthase subunit alpha [Planctomycetales bacterium 4572_13]|nr:MAG: tryptophan synthase subunit alpha [Planctomycetales bacterium 4572_13]